MGMNGKREKGKYQRCETYMTSSSFISLLYAIIMTCLLPLLFKAYISSTNLFLIEKSIPENRLNLMKYYPYCNGSSFLIFLTISKFADKRVIAKVPSLNAITPLSLSISIFLFTLCFEVNHSLINCFLYTYSFKTCFIITIFHINHGKKSMLCGILYQIDTLFLFLVIVSNMSLLNPGPERLDGISCFFHNVQGFVNLNSISKPSPDSNITKIMEFQAYIFEKAPGIIILNEMWLKPSINSNEIIPCKSYKIFRKDCSSFSHPPDPDNPQKFKLNGRGVLIAVKNSLNLHPKEIKCSTQAEFLSVKLSLPNRKKIRVSTLYRFGTLGYSNFTQVEKHLFKIFRSRKYKHNFIAGDFNLDSVDWHRNTISNNAHMPFINLFCDLALITISF